MSVTVRLDPAVKAAISSSEQDAWTAIRYPNAIFDEASGTWVSRAEVAEAPYTAFNIRKTAVRVPGRLVVRIEKVDADLKVSALADLLSRQFTANSAWLRRPPVG